MSKPIDDGGPAFPCAEDHKIAADIDWTAGMSLRDWFAGRALAGCLAYSHHNENWGDYHNNGSDADLASKVYRMADAMIAERAKPAAQEAAE